MCFLPIGACQMASIVACPSAHNRLACSCGQQAAVHSAMNNPASCTRWRTPLAVCLGLPTCSRPITLTAEQEVADRVFAQVRTRFDLAALVALACTSKPRASKAVACPQRPQPCCDMV